MSRTTKTIRNELFETMEALKKGRCTVKEAQAVAKIASQIVYTTRLELENKRMELKYNNSVPSSCHTMTIPKLKV